MVHEDSGFHMMRRLTNHYRLLLYKVEGRLPSTDFELDNQIATGADSAHSPTRVEHP
jgi:hypothetical protein